MPDTHVRRALRGGASLNRVCDLMQVQRPAGVRALMSMYDEGIVLEEPVIADDGVALGGHHKITLRSDGGYTYGGHFRATGWPSYGVSLAAHVIGPDGISVAVVAQDDVHGTNEAGDREYSWALEGFNTLISEHWPRLRGARIEHDLEYDVDVFGTPGQVLAFVAKSVAGIALAGVVGPTVVLSLEAIDELDLDELALSGTAGVLLAGSIVLVFGPAAMIPASLVGVATAWRDSPTRRRSQTITAT